MKISGLSCPVCCETHFKNLTDLRDTLVEVTTKCISCPLCKEELSGLDKFTIHLFTHRDTSSVVDISENTEANNKYNKTNHEDSYSIILESPTQTSLPLQISSPLQLSSSMEELAEETYETQTSNSISNLCNSNIAIIESETVRCDICNISFSDANILNMHKSLLHTNGFSCHLCHKRFKMQGSLMVHMRVAHYGFGQAVGTSNRSSRETNQEQPIPLPSNAVDNKQWECDVCLKKFTTKYFLKKHKRLHTGEMPYVCGLCGKSFTFQQSYHKHMLYHSEDKPHTCTECGRAFKELSTLHNHQRIHSGERPFACETCGKCFRQRVSYLVHRRIHTGAMPYRCTSCDKRFRYKVSQRTHKCKAQPPGAVVRQFGDLVHRLLLQHNVHSTQPTHLIPDTNDEQTDTAPSANEQCSTVNEECFKRLLYDTDNVS